MTRINHTVDYCDRCGKDVSTVIKGRRLSKGLVHLFWSGRIDFIDEYGAIMVSGEKNDSVDLCNKCITEIEDFIHNKKKIN